ncbi:radical SAM protein [Mucilaginibacter sp. PPCGB 2223]|uniref:B12-binding domain-containing radical SAM protein n=1 Tax=Mucilaginibacter sp. PPCGB 2223 TaxID=1886027 RepID=UPI000825AFFC|nr:radical SAM protein [Mucilaginibacter sp. PPCGB 2223]OCX50233.1 radical SAM protein [Mucilaginibacter sp. PPCGB 2223]
MNKILFSHSYFLRFDPKQWELGQPYAPLGTLYAASLMRRNGYEVSLFDTMFASAAREVMPALLQHQPDLFVVYDDGFNYLTKMCLTNMRGAAFEMFRLAKEQGCTVIVSSSDSTDRYKDYLHAGADFVLIGEAETSLLELANAIKQGATDYDHIEGIAFTEGSSIKKTAGRPVLKDLDILPLPAWDLVDIEPYREAWLKSKGYFSMNMGTTRGCPFKCNWCAKPIYGSRYNSRSPENVIAELKYLKQHYNPGHIWFCDDIFGLKPGWVHRFAELVAEENLHFKYKIQSRADLLLNDDQIEALAASGCDNVWIGAESGSQKILDAMDKGTTIQQIREATKLLKKHLIKPSFFIQFGYPGETKADISLTIKMIAELLPHEIGISVSYPLPGTVFYDRVRTELQKKTNWTDSDEMALMYKNTYSPAFYKQLHRYVHQNYHQHLAKDSLLKLIRNPLAATYNNLKKAASILYYVPLALIEKYKLQRAERLTA